jgi:hypothetical protein
MEHTLTIAQNWDGTPVSEMASVKLTKKARRLEVNVVARFYDDPPPPGDAGQQDELWKYEVVELFIAGADDKYIEIELGPHGHHLVLTFKGVRQREYIVPRVKTEVRIDGGIWVGTIRIPANRLPKPPWRVNAFAIHGEGKEREYLAHRGMPGEQPDFHRLESFVALT